MDSSDSFMYIYKGEFYNFRKILKQAETEVVPSSSLVEVEVEVEVEVGVEVGAEVKVGV